MTLAAHGRGLDSSERVAAYPLDAYPLEVHLNSRLDIRVVRARDTARLVRVRVQVRDSVQARVRVSQPIAIPVPEPDPDPLTMTVTVT